MGFEIDLVREVVERVAVSNGLEVVEVELRGAGKSRMLRIFIDKPGGVTHEDCANLSREVGTILDVEDTIPGGQYLLEVSSPGLDRKLSRPADFERFVGSRVKLTTREPIDGNRHFEGQLQSFQNGRLTLLLERFKKPAKNAGKNKPAEADSTPQILELELTNVDKANLVPEI